MAGLAPQLTRIGDEYREDLCPPCQNKILLAQRRCRYKNGEPSLYQRITLANASNQICTPCRARILTKAQAIRNMNTVNN